MLKVHHEQHGQSLTELRRLALEAEHPRTRERFLALYEIASGARHATAIADLTQRHDQTIHGWVHDYNLHGPDAMTYTRTGGSRPFDEAHQQALVELVRTSPAGQPVNWTLRKLVLWLACVHHVQACRETVRRVLHRAEFSYKKATKVLERACPRKRAEYLERLAPLLEEATRGQRLLLFLDPAHIHQECDLGYGWAPVGQRLHVLSSSPGLSERVTFYGIYVYNEGSVRIWPYERANALHTIEVLERLSVEFKQENVTIFWDGAAYHRARIVQEKVAEIGWELMPLPGYSPDFMPVEELWRWFRSEVTWNQVHETSEDLIAHAAAFEREINAHPYDIADRLVVLDHVDPYVEELRFSA